MVSETEQSALRCSRTKDMNCKDGSFATVEIE